MPIAVSNLHLQRIAERCSNRLPPKGGIITDARSDGYCDKSDFKTKLSDCLECALEFDIWKYYGNSVSSAAEECGLDATPVEGSSSSSSSASASETATATETSSQTESSSTPTESSTESTSASEETTDSSTTVSSTPVIPTTTTPTATTTPGSSVSFSAHVPTE